jgi:hypothetical protein
MRTAFANGDRPAASVKQQPQWLAASYEVLAEKNSNLQLGVGAIFRYDRCAVVRTASILDQVANVWLACKPLIQQMLGSVEC